MKKLLLQSALLAAGFLLLAGCTNVATFDYSAAAEPMVSFAGPPEAKSIAVLPFLDQRSRKSLQQLAPAADSGSFYLGLLPLMPYGYVKKPFPERSDDFVSLGRFHFNPSLDLAEASVLSLKASRLFGRVELADSAGPDRRGVPLARECQQYVLFGCDADLLHQLLSLPGALGGRSA